METFYYYSRNRKKPPFKVTINVEGRTVYINCDCDLGIEKKLCRHKINAIRADRQTADTKTSSFVIDELAKLFPMASTVRQYMEKEWRALRTSNCVDDEEHSRRLGIGTALADGFKNEETWDRAEKYIKQLTNMVGTGEVITIFSFSQPSGERLEVVPLELCGHYLKAHNCESGETKSYNLSLIELEK